MRRTRSACAPPAGASRCALLLPLLLGALAGLVGSTIVREAPAANATAQAEVETALEESGETMVDGAGASDGDSGAALKPTERFRRLIPYMTFYFAQQGLGQRPQFQQYEGPAPSIAQPPRYQGNLAVPAGYLVRAKVTARPPRPFRPPPAPQTSTALPAPQPRPFSLAYDPLLYAPRPSAPPPPPPPQPVAPAPPPPPPPPLTPEQRTAALFRLLVLLQRRAQQGTPVSSSSVAALAQTLTLLQAAQQLPGEAPGAVAKLLAHQLLTAPPAPPVPPRPPVATLYGSRVPAAHTPPVKQALLPLQVTTLAPDVSPDLLYNTVSPSPAPAPPPTLAPLPAASPTPLAHSDEDLQNYLTPVRVAHVEVLPNGQDVHSPLKLTTVAPAPPAPPTPPPPPAPPAPPARRPYGYASKAPPAGTHAAPALLGRVTFTQSFPDPDAEGGTPGRPGVDYPTLASIPATDFDCKAQRYKGFFGDPETHCQVWHYCDLNGGQASFLCPNGTIFSQVALTCDWWFNVRCASTPQLYVLNERLYKYILPVMPSFPEDFTGPLVDQYLTLKFREQEQKSKAKAKGAKSSTTTPKPPSSPPPPSAQPTQNTLEDLEDS